MKRIIKGIIISMVLVTMVLMLFDGAEYALGWIWGCIGNIAYFSMLALKLRQAAFLDPVEGAILIKKGLFVRWSIIALVVCVAILSPMLNILATTMGLVSLTIVFYADHLVQILIKSRTPDGHL